MHVFNTEARIFDHFLNFPNRANVHHTHIENAYFPKPDNPTASNVTRLEQVEYLKTSTNEWIYGL